MKLDFLTGYGHPIQEGILIKRYKRFLADIKLPNKKTPLTVHCPNTGSMKGLNIPGRPVLISDSENSERKLKYTLECIKIGKAWVCVNTHRANELTQILLEKYPRLFPHPYTEITREKKYNQNTRFDFFLKQKKSEGTFLEVKAVTLSEAKGIASFPDAITERGQKHLKHLMQWKKKGNNSVIFYLCLRNDCSSFTPADHIDSEYGTLLKQAHKSGVFVIVQKIHIKKTGFYTDLSKLKIEL